MSGVMKRTSYSVLLGLCLGFLQCQGTDAVEEEVIRLKASTVPSGSVNLFFEPLSRDTKSARAEWSFDCRTDWGTYAQWVQQSVSGEYKIRAEKSQMLVFRRVLEGDTYALLIESADSARRIRIRFYGEPF